MTISEKVKKGLASDLFMDQMAGDALALQQKYGKDKVFDLTLSYPSVEPPPAFAEELKKLMAVPRPGLHRYMENAGYTDTRAAVAARLAQETGLKFTANQVIMTSGASGALNMAFKAVLNPGEEVILLSPPFYDYKAYVENHAGVYKIIDCDAGFLPDLAALEAAITPKTKVLVINSPNNPSGIVYSDDILKQIAEAVTRKSIQLKTTVYVVSDDSYRQFYYGDGSCPWIINHYPHTMVVNSYSKEISVPGERIGFIAVHPDCDDAGSVIGGLIHANRTLGFVNAPGLMQNAVRNLPGNSVNTAGYRQKRDFLYDHLVRLGYSIIKPEGTFYLFPETPIKDDFTFVNELKSHLVLTVPGSLFQAPGHIRVSYCVDEKLLAGSLDGFRKAIEKYRA